MPGIGFLFWNAAQRPLEQRIARIVALRGVDVVLLAEYSAAGIDLTTALGGAGAGAFHEATSSGDRLRVFSRLDSQVLQPQFPDPDGRWSIYRVVPGWAPEFFLALAHLPSKLNADERKQAMIARRFAADIVAVEDNSNHRRTMVVGDLNMNPFEEGVAGAEALHGVMTRAVAGWEERVVLRRSYPLFYNPMWGLMGDWGRVAPPGTYYRSAADAVNYFWNTYDQVLLRPGLMDRLTALEVLDSDGAASLLTARGIPDVTAGSDHLPVYFRLNW